MHQGGEGTHKDGGTEIWVFDIATHQRLARWPMHAAEARDVARDTGVAGRRARSFRRHGQGGPGVFDALTGHIRHVEKHLGQTPWILLNP